MNKYILKNGIILDGNENMKPYKADILVNNGIIEDIITNGKSPSECSEIDLDGKYIMPGLINMHVHLAGNGKPQKKQRDNEKLVKKSLRHQLADLQLQSWLKIMPRLN